MTLLIFRLTTWTAQRMPRSLLDFLVGFALRWGFFMHPLRRRIILSNYKRILSHAGLDCAPEKLKSILEETRPLYARCLTSMLGRPEDVEFARDNVDLQDLLKHLEKARLGGRGVILVCSNFGQFPALLQALALRQIPLRIPILDRRTVSHLPLGWPELFLTVGKSAQECLEALRRNQVVVILTMVNHMPRRIDLELFGAPARLAYAPARLAKASGAPLLPVFALYENGRCRACCDGPVASMQALTEAQEKFISRYPAQWHVYEDLWDRKWMDANYRFARFFLRWF